jgi:hypothetical protein
MDIDSATDETSKLEEISSQVDLILVRVFEEKLAAFASALRRFQFPSDESSAHSDGRVNLASAQQT